MGDSDRRELEDRAEVQSQACAARMVPAGCVHKQDVRPFGKLQHRGFE